MIKGLKNIFLKGTLLFTAGYAMHLGGCNSQKAGDYLTKVSNRIQITYHKIKETYRTAEPILRDIHEKTGKAYDDAEPKLIEAYEIAQRMNNKTRKTLDSLKEDKTKPDKDKPKKVTLVTMACSEE